MAEINGGELLTTYKSWDDPPSGVHHKHQPLHDKVNPKDCQVSSFSVMQGFSNFFEGLFQVMTRQTPYMEPYLEPQTTSFKWMLGETSHLSMVMI